MIIGIEVGSRKTEDRRRKSEDRRRKSEDRRQKTEDRRNKRRLIPPWRRGLGGLAV